MADRIGRRRRFRIGLLGFVLSSLACAVAPNLPALILGRVVQGAASVMGAAVGATLFVANACGSTRPGDFDTVWTLCGLSSRCGLLPFSNGPNFRIPGC